MYSKPNLFVFVSLWLVLIPSTIAQQFTLEATIDKEIYLIFDIDGDGVCEYTADTNKVYDGSTHQLKYTLPDQSWRILYGMDRHLNPSGQFPHIDFNSDGNRDLLILAQPWNWGIFIYDIINNQIIFEFDPPEDYAGFGDLIDIDGDGQLELVLFGYTYPDAYSRIWKTYIYSTGVAVTSVPVSENNQPYNFKLRQNYPNLFNPSTAIKYSLSSPEEVSINIYDVSGHLIREINQEHSQPGEYQVMWDGKNKFGESVSSGAYFYQLSVGNKVAAKKMILLK